MDKEQSMMNKPGLFLSLMCISVAACVAAPGVPEGDGKPDLTFIHLNDTYRVGAVEEGSRGGFSRVATIVSQLNAEGRDVRILHAGDFLFPSLESQLWGGEQMVEAFNFLDALAPMYVVPGNHEFDPRTPDSLIRAINQSRFDWLGDNLRFATGNSEADSKLRSGFTFASGDHTVGIFALTLHAEDGGDDRDYAAISREYVARAEKTIEEFESSGVDLIIGLTHLHLSDDIEIAKLKAAHPKFLFIVGGHEHEPEHANATSGSAEIMKGGSNARSIWQVDVYFDERGEAETQSKMITVDESIELYADYEPIAEKWQTLLLQKLPFLPGKIGTAALPMDAREETVRNEESSWGDFIADQMLTAFRDPPVELAFVNGGTLRIDDYIAEDITFEDIGRTFGFSSYLRYMTLSGADFRDLLEAGYRGEGPSKGYFPQIAGFRVCIDRKRPVGQRIVEMLVPVADGWQEIVADRDYSVVAPDYLFRGGDGYDFAKARNVSRPGSELQYLVLDAILNAQAEGKAVGKPVDREEPRIAFLQPGRSACFD